VIFFYTAESRVDFRELIKKYAEAFRVKIEMRHISYREEASRLGGTGVCGRELCCSTWLTDYKQVNTGAARAQNLSINMEKLSGQCGRLKCCLNYELDTYLEATAAFPKAKVVKLDTVSGMAYSKKTDILKRLMWFSYEDNSDWIPLEVDKVNELIEKNKSGEQVGALADMAPANILLAKVVEQEGENDFVDSADLLKDDEFKHLGKNKKRKGSSNQKGRRNNNKRKDRNDGPRTEGQKKTQNKEFKDKPKKEGDNKPRNQKNRGPRKPKGKGPGFKPVDKKD
jgi:hypothetical protein